MPCQRCIQAIQEAGNVLQEMAFCDPETLPPGRDWAALGTELVRLAGHLRTHTHEEPQHGRDP
jgi:hypothetical protein